VFPLSQIAEMFCIASLGMVKDTSEPANTGVDVLVGVEFGTVAVCVPVPTDKYAMFGPMFTTRSVLPAFGRAVDELAVPVTLTGSVSVLNVKGSWGMSGP
jgi:hypothetical protein